MDDLFFVICEVSLGLVALVLDGNLVVELGRFFFCSEGSQIFLFPVDHDENLPRVAILGDSSELGASEIIYFVAFEGFSVRLNDQLVALSGLQ